MCLSGWFRFLGFLRSPPISSERCRDNAWKGRWQKETSGFALLLRRDLKCNGDLGVVVVVECGAVDGRDLRLVVLGGAARVRLATEEAPQLHLKVLPHQVVDKQVHERAS